MTSRYYCAIFSILWRRTDDWATTGIPVKSRGLSCDPALSVHDNVNHHQYNTRDQHMNT